MNRFEELRKSRRLSQKQIADMLGITQQGYSNYEKGVREADYETLTKLADYFDTTIDYLLGNSNYPKSLNGNAHPTPEELLRQLMEASDFSEESKKIMISNFDLLKKLENAKANNDLRSASMTPGFS